MTRMAIPTLAALVLQGVYEALPLDAGHVRHSTGLGLGFAKQVVENHGGSVWLESEKGKYTRATICLREGKDEYGEQENDSGH